MKEINNIKRASVKEQGISLLEEVEIKAFEIYKKALASKEFSEYYLLELMKQNDLLKTDVNTALNMIKKGLKEEKASSKKDRYKLVTVGTICVLISMSVPITTLILLPTYVALVSKYLKNRNEIIRNKIIENEQTYISKKEKDIMTNIDNNETFLRKKYKELSKSRISKIEENPERIYKVMNANIIIQDYINYGKEPDNIDEETKKVVISMLRQDLDTKETDLKTLLEMAKAEVKQEEIIRTLKNNN